MSLSYSVRLLQVHENRLSHKYIYHNDTEKSADSQQQKKESTACRFHFPVETDIGLLTLKSQRKPTVREIYDLRRVD